MSNNKQRKARQRAEKRDWQQTQLAEGRRRRKVMLGGVLVGVVAVTLVVALVVTLAGGSSPDAETEQKTEPPQVVSTEMLDSEAAADAQSDAAAKAMAAGEVVAEDFTVEPGTPVDSGEEPGPDARPVACGAKEPVNAREARSRYPGGPGEVLREGVDYIARVETSCGTIVIDLLEDEAPLAVNSFVFLAKEGFYDGLEVFRDFGGIAAAQAGSGNNTLEWDIGYRLPDELELAKREGYPIGTVTTAAETPDTAGSEFLIAYGKQFDAGFQTAQTQTAFGRVLKGMDVVYTMTAMDRVGMGGEAFAERLFMESVTIEER